MACLLSTEDGQRTEEESITPLCDSSDWSCQILIFKNPTGNSVANVLAWRKWILGDQLEAIEVIDGRDDKMLE